MESTNRRSGCTFSDEVVDGPNLGMSHIQQDVHSVFRRIDNKIVAADLIIKNH